MENLELKEINNSALILAKGEENITKFDKKNINKFLDGKISFNQLLRRILKSSIYKSENFRQNINSEL